MKLSFLGCGTKPRGYISKHGNNSAFLKAERNGEETMLLMDCGSKIPRVMNRAHVLDNVHNLILFISHTHPDHIFGTKELSNTCVRNNIKMGLLLPPYKAERESILTNLEKMKVPMRTLSTVCPYEAAYFMKLHGIDFERIDHHQKLKTIALILKTRTFSPQMRTVTVFAPDHNDPDFINSVINDEGLETLYTDCTEKRESVGTSHLPFETLKRIVPKDSDLRKRICLMHMTPQLPMLAGCEGFETADKLLYVPDVSVENCREVKQDRYLPKMNRSAAGKKTRTFKLKKSVLEKKIDCAQLPAAVLNNFLNRNRIDQTR